MTNIKTYIQENFEEYNTIIKKNLSTVNLPEEYTKEDIIGQVTIKIFNLKSEEVNYVKSFIIKTVESVLSDLKTN